MTSFLNRRPLLIATAGLLAAGPAVAGPPYQPPGSNLTLGDVTHGQRAQSASTNPAAGAVDMARDGSKPLRGTVLSAAGGIEYGNVDKIFELYDELAGGYEPSDPDSGVNLPTQLPAESGGIDLGELWDRLDPDTQAAIEAIAGEVATQAALLSLIATEGYARAWVSADVPILFGKQFADGNWTAGINWSGGSRAFGVSDPIEFDREEARSRLDEWLNTLPVVRPPDVSLGGDVQIAVDPTTNDVLLSLRNDSSIIAKAAQTTDLSLGYSRPAWATDNGTLYLGLEGHVYFQRLSRYTARFGDITDSEELFDEIRNAEFRNDEDVGFDVGALWVGENYHLGAQVINVNEPSFEFPAVNLEPYSSETTIERIRRDQIFTMDRQLKLEGSVFGKNRHWSLHAGYDADPVTDVLGDRYQWATLSAGYRSDSVWIPSARFGVRRNLAGTELTYLSAGVTAFKFVNFDVSSSLNSVTINGQDLPQGLMASLGINIVW